MAGTTLRAPTRARWASVVSIAAVLLTGCGTTTPPPPTAKVERGSVSVSVSASGALSAVQAQNLGFPKMGQLKELLVKVGDPVQPGQLLARLDDANAQQMLNQARGRLAQAQAMLAKIVNGNSVDAAEDTLEQAQRILDKTRATAAAINKADSDATEQARRQLDLAKKQRDRARSALDLCIASYAPSPPPPGACAAEQTALNMAEQQVQTARSALDAAENKERIDAAQGRLNIENARQGVVTAQNNLEAARSGTPADRDAAAGAVTDAQGAVALAQIDLDNTFLRAPVAGTISAINGTVGEFIGQGSSTTPLAPGSDAAIPGVSAAVSDQGNGGGGGGGPTQPGGSNFMVLGDVNSFQVVVPFEESDAAKVAPNQKVEVTFDAIPDLVRAGTVLAVAPVGTAISGVTNYYVTIALTETDPRLRDRQTAQAAVSIGQVDNVLTVPNAAVIRQGDQAFVNVPGPDGQPLRVPFQPGLMGDDRTEVRSGLTEGQEVQLPQAQVTATPDNQRGPTS